MDLDQPFEPGMVFAIEPFLSMPEEGISVSIDDGMIITKIGSKMLAVPLREIQEVEAIWPG